MEEFKTWERKERRKVDLGGRMCRAVERHTVKVETPERFEVELAHLKKYGQDFGVFCWDSEGKNSDDQEKLWPDYYAERREANRQGRLTCDSPIQQVGIFEENGDVTTYIFRFRPNLKDQGRATGCGATALRKFNEWFFGNGFLIMGVFDRQEAEALWKADVRVVDLERRFRQYYDLAPGACVARLVILAFSPAAQLIPLPLEIGVVLHFWYLFPR